MTISPVGFCSLQSLQLYNLRLLVWSTREIRTVLMEIHLRGEFRSGHSRGHNFWMCKRLVLWILTKFIDEITVWRIMGQVETLKNTERLTPVRSGLREE